LQEERIKQSLEKTAVLCVIGASKERASGNKQRGSQFIRAAIARTVAVERKFESEIEIERERESQLLAKTTKQRTTSGIGTVRGIDGRRASSIQCAVRRVLWSVGCVELCCVVLC
jgi:hypothetical protein